MTTQTPDAVREALRPFSDLADWIDANRPRHANPSMEVQVENWPYTLSVEWLYNARKALASLDGRAGDARPALEVGRKFLAACNSAWSCGKPYHRVKTMMDRADDFQKALDAYDAILATPAPAVDAKERRTCPGCEGSGVGEVSDCCFICDGSGKITDTPAVDAVPAGEVEQAGQFLLDRLVDHEVRMTSEDDAREWHGHVTPAMARFRAALSHGEGRK
ncbi:hypothetical protein [uncultured Sphingomonas sp.]|uniref:hypothetical protein n=1 Tax=uncultured Sphingomonas sp. TaxID=158754 RepID=UPI0037491CD4